MAERLTKKISKTIQDKYSLGSYLYYDFAEIDDTNKLLNKLGKLEDILEKCGIESVEELDDLIANYRTSPILTEEMIKEIAVNEQRKVIQSMIKEITEKECNQLYTELNTWKRACELACDVILRFTDGCPCKADYFYQQAKKEGEKNNVY